MCKECVWKLLWYKLHLSSLANYILAISKVQENEERLELECFKSVIMHYLRSRGSSISIVSDCGQDDRVIGVRSPAGTKDFSSNLCVQTISEAHPSSCTMGTGGPFPGAKRSWGMTLTTHPHLVPRSRMSRSYTSSPPMCHHGI
jgi:hypothetical protein